MTLDDLRARIMPTTHVALLGADSGSLYLAPFRNPEWTIWSHVCLSAADVREESPDGDGEGRSVPLASFVHAWFDVHKEEIWSEPKKWNPDYQRWLAGETDPLLTRPVLMQSVFETVPTSLAYPFAEMRRAFPHAYWGSTFDWMTSLALLLGAETIGYWGIHMATLHERLYQRPGVDYWLGRAHGMDVRTVIPSPSPIGRNVLPGDYGPDFPPWPDGHHPHQFAGRAMLKLGEFGDWVCEVAPVSRFQILPKPDRVVSPAAPGLQ